MNKNQWQPASDLPDSDTTVLIAVADADAEPVWLGYWDSEDASWRYISGTRCIERVTHWMDLPEKPEVSDSREKPEVVKC